MLTPVFSKQQALPLPPFKPYNCPTDLLLGAPLPSRRSYNLSGPKKETTRKYVDESLKSGIIRPSTSSVGAGFFFCVQERQNTETMYRFQRVSSDNCLEQISYSDQLCTWTIPRYYFHQNDPPITPTIYLVRFQEGDEWKTAFKAPLGHFEYLVVPFGLTKAPAVFEALVSKVLRDFFKNIFAIVYLDDILIYSRDEQQHTKQCKSVTFLGFVFEKGQVYSDPAKTTAE